MENRPENAKRPKALLRFYAISAVIVLTIAVIVAGYANRDRIRLKLASVYASMPPKAAQAGAEGVNRARLSIVAPWVLSALPECLRQTFEAAGTRGFVAAKLPRGYAKQLSGTLLRYADCTIVVNQNNLFVHRGKDKFWMPAAQLYRKGDSLALIYGSGSREVLRIYQAAPRTL